MIEFFLGLYCLGTLSLSNTNPKKTQWTIFIFFLWFFLDSFFFGGWLLFWFVSLKANVPKQYNPPKKNWTAGSGSAVFQLHVHRFDIWKCCVFFVCIFFVFFVFSMFFWFLQPGTTLTAEKLQLLQQLQKNYRYYSNCRETTATGATAEKLQLLQLLQGNYSYYSYCRETATTTATAEKLQLLQLLQRNYSFYNYCRETAATTATAEELQLLQQLQRNYSYYSYCRETAATTATAEKLQLLHLFF